MQRLKDETREQHEAIERQIDLLRAWDIRSYRQLLEGFYGFYEPLEPHLWGFAQWQQDGFSVGPRRKTPRLQDDLESLGLSPQAIDTLPRCTHLPTIDSFSQALGCAYVLEGSTLGGQIIARHLRHELRNGDNLLGDSGLGFFCSYGDQVGTMWKGFGAFLNRQVAVADDRAFDDVVIQAANQTFGCLRRWMRVSSQP